MRPLYLMKSCRSLFNRTISRAMLGIFIIFLFCEYFIFYITQSQCDWPKMKKNNAKDVDPVHAIVLADIHLLGLRNGHWLDIALQEWQMLRGFQTAMTVHRPELVFVLGDLFDEGKWCSQVEFNLYVERFHRLFAVPEGTSIYAVVGNHDIGFHYKITPQLAKRFEKSLKAPPVSLISVRDNHFVLINSMAMEGDGCTLCSNATAEINRISDVFKCSNGSKLCKDKTQQTVPKYSRPIIMQHFPLYRESDSVCTEPDAAPLPERNNLFEERWDCLSKESTEYLIENLLPRAVFGAHTHHSCVLRHSFVPRPDHKIEFIEYTVPSFSWRNRLDPKYYLLTVTPDELRMAKCELPRESTIQITAVVLTMALVTYIRYYYSITRRSLRHMSDKQV